MHATEHTDGATHCHHLPAGWYCTRDPYHDGPWALWPRCVGAPSLVGSLEGNLAMTATFDPGRKCSIEGCEKPAGKRKGWCRMHYMRWERHRDPMVVKKREYPTDIAYRSAHARLARQNGKASNYRCDECGAQAEEWSYVGGDPDERHAKGGAYSLKPEFYRALCVPCHRREDAAKRPRATECHRGHPFTEENTYTAKGGSRDCRKCAVERDRKRREQRRETFA